MPSKSTVTIRALLKYDLTVDRRTPASTSYMEDIGSRKFVLSVDCRLRELFIVATGNCGG